MEILLKLFATVGLVMGTVFALLPGSFGLLNYRREHSDTGRSRLATLTWWLLVLAHPLALYQLWLSDAYPYLWLLVPLPLHLLFFSLFGRNLSTR